MKKIMFVMVIFVFWSVLFLEGQWGPDMRLTFDAASSRTSYCNAKCVDASGGYVHVVWADDRGGDWQIYYKRSGDYGTTWGADVRLISTTRDAWHPCVDVSGTNVYTIWEDFRLVNWEIYEKTSNDNGSNWGSDTRVSSTILNSSYPSFAVSHDTMYVVWQDNSSSNFWDICFIRSTDGGSTWGTQDVIVTRNANSMQPSIAISGPNVHIVWWDDRDGVNGEIYYKHSTDHGATWGSDVRLTDNAEVSWYPCISVSGSNIHIVWWDFRDGNFEIYYKRSTDSGVSWGSDIRLTNNSGYSADPSVAVSGANVFVVWWDDRDGNKEIYYKTSTDNGSMWGTDTRLTTANGNSWYPSINASGDYLHLVWSDDRDGNWEIYYKRNAILGIEEPCFTAKGEFNWVILRWRLAMEDECLQYIVLKKFTRDNDYKEIARISGSGSSPSPQSYLYKDEDVKPGIRYFYKLGMVKANGNTEMYGPVSAMVTSTKSFLRISPNPFTEKTVIRYSLIVNSKDSHLKPYSLRIYDTCGRLVKRFTINDTRFTEVVWDGKDDKGKTLLSGIYLCRLACGRKSITKRILLTK